MPLPLSCPSRPRVLRPAAGPPPSHRSSARPQVLRGSSAWLRVLRGSSVVPPRLAPRPGGWREGRVERRARGGPAEDPQPGGGPAARRVLLLYAPPHRTAAKNLVREGGRSQTTRDLTNQQVHGGTRTRNLLIRSQTRYPRRHRPKLRGVCATSTGRAHPSSLAAARQTAKNRPMAARGPSARARQSTVSGTRKTALRKQRARTAHTRRSAEEAEGTHGTHAAQRRAGRR